MLYAICSIVMQKVVGMSRVSREDQQHAHAYALRKLADEGGGGGGGGGDGDDAGCVDFAMDD